MANKISLHRLTVQNFRAFEGKHTIEFEENGLYLVRGFNLDTRGESAAGKSSLFHAIAYALDYAPYSATELRCWHNEEPMFVELELKTAEGIVTVHRGDKLWLKREWEEKPVTSAKAVAEALDELCGMNKTLRSAITYRKQRTFGIFLSKKDREKKEFLVELLKLQWLEKDIDDAVKDVSRVEGWLAIKLNTLDNYKANLSEARSQVPKLVEIETADMQKEVAHWRAVMEKARDEAENKRYEYEEAKRTEAIAAEEANHSNDEEIGKLLELIKVIETQQFQFDFSKAAEAIKVLEQCQVRLSRVAGSEVEAAEYRTEIRQLEAEMEHLLVMFCPKCQREWPGATSEAFNVKKRIGVLKEALMGAEADVVTLDRLRLLEKKLLDDVAREKEILKAREEVAQSARREEISNLKVRISLLGSQASQKRCDVLFAPSNPSKKLYADMSNSVDERDMALQKLNHASARLDRAVSDNAFNRKEHDIRFKEVLRRATEVAKAQKEYDDCQEGLNEARDYLEMQRGFLGKYFSEVLQQISHRTNKIIASLPNAKRITLRFDTDRKTQDGNLRNEITPVASFSGKEWSLEAGASGGMFTSVELAVDLGVTDVISERTGVDLGWLILDESFANGSDSITKQGCLEILQSYAKNKLVIMVEHASDFKEMFSRVIEIEFQNERSRIR